MSQQALVAIVDDDDSVREAICTLVNQLGFATRDFSSAESLLASECAAEIGCLILDVALPGMSGPGLQLELADRGHAIPIIFITAHRDERVRERVMQQNAIACLTKPFIEADLIEALNRVFAESQRSQESIP
jgi:FixJ family two-component response regulator